MKITSTKNFISKWLVVAALTFGLLGVSPSFQSEYSVRVKTECVANPQHKRKILPFVKLTKRVNNKEKFPSAFIQLHLANQLKLVLSNHALAFSSLKFYPFQAAPYSSNEDALILS